MALTLLKEEQTPKKADDRDNEERPGGLGYLEKLIRLKTASDLITNLQRLIGVVRNEIEKFEVVVEITHSAVMAATESTEAYTTGVEAIAEADQVLDHLKNLEAKDKEKESDIDKITQAKETVVSGIKEATESAKSAVETCKKYTGKESLAEFTLEGIKEDLEAVKNLNANAKEAHQKVVTAHKTIKAIKAKRGITDNKTELVRQNSGAELKTNVKNLDDYRAEALALLEKEGLSLKGSQELQAVANGQANAANNMLERARTELTRLENELKAAAESAKNGQTLSPAAAANSNFRLTP